VITFIQTPRVCLQRWYRPLWNLCVWWNWKRLVVVGQIVRFGVSAESLTCKAI